MHHVSKKYIDRMIIKLEQNKAKRKGEKEKNATYGTLGSKC